MDSEVGDGITCVCTWMHVLVTKCDADILGESFLLEYLGMKRDVSSGHFLLQLFFHFLGKI